MEPRDQIPVEELPESERPKAVPAPSYDERTPEQRGYRSLFWPIMLIGAGVVLLLANLNLLQIDPLSLWRLWPLLLIVAGIDILFSRRFPALGALLGLVVVGGAIGLLLVSPQTSAGILGIPQPLEPQTSRFSEPLNGAQAAEITLELRPGPTTIRALDDPDRLFEAEVTHVFPVEYTVSGGRTREIFLGSPSGPQSYNLEPAFLNNLEWDVAINPAVALDLTVTASIGSTEMDLSQMALDRLDFTGSVGSSEISLPGTAFDLDITTSTGETLIDIADGADVRGDVTLSVGHTEIDAGRRAVLDLDITSSTGSLVMALGEDSEAVIDLTGSVGENRLTLAEGAALDLEFSGSTGDLIVEAPRGSAIRVIVESDGVGSVQLPPDLIQTEHGDGDEGTWETDGFARAGRQIVIRVRSISVGDVIVRYR
ncbi:MAG: hypothetical protein Kow00124_20240 [Anaerolineae bacterium]